MNSRHSLHGHAEETARIGLPQVGFGGEWKVLKIFEGAQVLRAYAGLVEFPAITRIVGVGVSQRRLQALELQGLQLRARRTQDRLSDSQCLNAGHGGVGASKLGRRFSRAADNPSRTSLSLNPRNSRASDVSKLGPARRSQLLSACLVQRIAVALPALKVRAMSKAVSMTCASGTATRTRPMRSASAPDKDLLVSKWYFALARPHSSGQMMTA